MITAFCFVQLKLLQRETGVEFGFFVAGEEPAGKNKGLRVVPYVKSSDDRTFQLLKEDNKTLDDDLCIKLMTAIKKRKAQKDV